MKTYPFLRVNRVGRSVGFTLTELLVVIAIIIILAGILTPSLVSARIQMLRTKCGNNEGEIAKACQAYSQDETMWRGSGSADAVLPSDGPDTSAGLFLLLMHRASIGRNLFLCPEAELRRDFKAPDEDDTAFVTDGSSNTTLSYAYLCQTYTDPDDGQPKHASSPQFLPGGMIILADDNPHFNTGSGEPPDNGVESNSQNHRSDDRAEGQNIADVGGAVRWVSNPIIFVRIESGSNIKDNIYTSGEGNDGTGGQTSQSSNRGTPEDIFLVP